MAENKNSEVTALSSQKSDEPTMDIIDNILQLNEDCLMLIMKNLKLIDLCAVSETCSRFKCVAGEVFQSQHKSYGIPQLGIEFKDHQRILINFGKLVTVATCITNFCNILDVAMNREQIITAFQWLERYCGESLQQLKIIGLEGEIDLPPSAIRLMSKVQKIDMMTPICDPMLQNALLNCNELVQLNLFMYDGPFHWQDHRFPHLQKLMHRVLLNCDTDFNKIETFFQHHTKLSDLSTQFLNHHGEHAIDFTFLKHLPDLTKLGFILVGAPIVGTEAFACLKKLQQFTVDSSSDKRTDALIFENLASVDSLVKLVLAFPEVSHLIAGIGRFTNLSKLEISSHDMAPFDEFDNANIASLSRLRNSSITELKVGCMKLLEPESIVKVIRNLKKMKTLKLDCEVELTEQVCRKLVKICSSQVRKLEIILEEEIIGDMNFDFDFIEKFNKENGVYVEVKIECDAVVIE